MSARLARIVAAGAAVACAGGGATAAALASAHSRPTVSVNQGCYQTAEKGTLHGTGFDPSAHWAAKLDGKSFGSGTTSSTGTITASFGAPSRLVKDSTGEDPYNLVVREGKHSATVSFLVTKLTAGFSPPSGNLLTLKVKFRLLGWGRGASLYLHYLTPNGSDRLDRSLGGAGGACGHLSTAPLKLFPFTPTTGKWTLQFDKESKYTSTTRPRVVIAYKIT